jgi:hypothetical protein
MSIGKSKWTEKFATFITAPIVAISCIGVGLFESLTLLLNVVSIALKLDPPNILTTACVVVSVMLVMSACYIRSYYTFRYSIAYDKECLNPNSRKRSLWLNAALSSKRK